MTEARRPRVTSEPAAEPVTRSEAKAHLRVDDPAEDTLIDSLITVARRSIERHCRRRLITTGLTLKLDRFYADIPLPDPPLIAVSSIQYVDTAGATQTLATSVYQVDTDREPGVVRPAYGEVWPVTQPDTANAVTIAYTAGFGATAASVPDELKHAMKLMIEHLYRQRGLAAAESVNEVPKAFQWLLDAWRTDL